MAYQPGFTSLVPAPKQTTPEEIKHPFTLITDQYEFAGVFTSITSRGDPEQEMVAWDGVLMANALDSAKDFAIFSLRAPDSEIDSIKVMFVSPSIKGLAGFSNPQDFSSWLTRIHKDDRQRFKDALKFTLDTKESLNEVIRVSASDYEHCRSLRFMVSVSESSPQGDMILTGMIFDITETENLKQSLYNTRRINQALLDSINASAFVIDQSGMIRSTGEKLFSELRDNSEDLIGSSLFELFSAENSAFLAHNIEKTMKTKSTVTCHILHRIHNSEFKYKLKLTDCGENQILVVIDRDCEGTQQKTGRKLSTAILDNIMNAISEDLLVVDGDNRIVSCNRSFELTSGYEASSLVDRKFSDFFSLPNNDKTMTDQGRLFEMLDYVLLTTSSRSRKQVALGINRLTDLEGNLLGKLIIVHDTEKQSDRSKENPVDNEPLYLKTGYRKLMHDLNNILSTILGNIDLFRISDSKTDSIAAEYLKNIENAALQARDMLSGMPAKDEQKDSVKTRQITVDELSNDFIEPVLLEKELEWVANIPDDLPDIETDPEIASHCFKSIIEGLTAINPARSSLFIEIMRVEQSTGQLSSLPEGEYVKIVVGFRNGGDTRADTSPLKIDRIAHFSEARNLISKAGGALEIISEAGQDLRANVYFKIAGTKQTKSPDTGEKVPENLRILVMDDKLEVRQVVGQILSELGYKTAFAADGTQAIKLYKDSLKKDLKFDAVIMDVNIPNGMGGEETVRRLRQIDPDVNAIVFSGCHNAHIMSNFHKFGFQGFVSKPFTLEELNRIVTDTIHKSHSGSHGCYNRKPD